MRRRGNCTSPALLLLAVLLGCAGPRIAWANQGQAHHGKSLRSQREHAPYGAALDGFYTDSGAASRRDASDYGSSRGGSGGHAPGGRAGLEVAHAPDDAAQPIEQQQQQQQRAGSPNKVPWFTILVMTTVMALMSGLGAVPFFFVDKLKNTWAGLANAVACGVMLAASFDLLHEGAPYSATLTIGGMVLGGLFIRASQEYLSQFEDASFEELSGADARKAMLIVGVMAAHAFGEGSGVGVSFSGNRGWAQGMLVTIAIGLHNIPEGMAVATVMVAKGTPPLRALWWSLLCALPQALVALPSYLFVETFSSLLPVALGFAAGCMVWIVSAELMPDALEAAPHPAVATACTLSAAWLQGLSMMIAKLERPDGQLASPILASGGALAHAALCMLPALCALPAAAALAAPAMPSLPASLGAAGGVLGALGALGVLAQLAAGRLAWAHALAWAAAGAGGVVLLWRNVIVSPANASGSGDAPGTLEVRRSLDPQFAVAGPGDHYDAKHHPPAGGGAAGGGYLHHGNGAAHAPDHALVVQHSGNGLLRTAAAPGGGGGYGQDCAAGVHQRGGAPPFYGGAALPQQQQQQQQQQQSAFGAYAAQHQGYGATAAGGGMVHVSLADEPGPGGPAWYAAGANGGVAHHGLHPLGAGGAGGQAHHAEGTLGGRSHSNGSDVAAAVAAAMHHKAATGGGGGGGGGGPLSTGSSQAVQAATLAAVLLAWHAAVGLGERAAAAVVRQAAGEGDGEGGGAATHWLVPLVLLGLPLGVASVGVGKALAGAGQRPAVWVAATAAACALLCALCCLAGVPLGAPAAGAQQLSGYDAAHWWPAARAAGAGAMAAGAALYVWPAAAATKVAQARAGAALGAAVTVVCGVLAAGLCAGTPYCLPA